MFNETMRKFGAPGSVIHSYKNWSVMLRPAQVTLGALVLAAHDPVDRFSLLSGESFIEMQEAIRDIEQVLYNTFAFDKINYLMLMMVDPDVHFHVVPRYSVNKSFESVEFTDPGWPGPPDLSHVNPTGAEHIKNLMEHIRSNWPET